MSKTFLKAVSKFRTHRDFQIKDLKFELFQVRDFIQMNINSKHKL